nr:unnamed protein product [Callosobruchus chinensis]
MNDNSPFCICIQETHLRHSEQFNLREYNTFRKEAHSETRAHGGIAVYVKDNIPATEIPINTHLQAIAVGIYYPNACTSATSKYTISRNTYQFGILVTTNLSHRS